MDNNKNRMKDKPKSNAELRKMKPKENSDLGIINGVKIGAYAQGKRSDRTYEWRNEGQELK
ncbi:hypothetical protein [Clostridium fallax]|uniref:Uncharacterized protein n=1 Tax=Clostridium fallax TaxID=1533 RepID=A0A1M4XUN9_9CLOT|nr:hypothetical protein [Clostridium fallax]SHE97110.1 hypothetical protein SAMN05443638_12115 [Clostridium fallax]SQB06531.1 Uncharacterised protein [Clostridium fallax]